VPYKIKTGRIKGDKPKSTFCVKKPFKAKGRNRKGKTKNSFLDSGVKKVGLNPDKAVRFPEAKYRERQEAVRGLGACQVCDISYELDAPHHVVQGLGVKDDRYLINICVDCHGLIHVVGYSAVKKSREECREIAWSNHLLLEGDSDEI